MRAGQLRHRIRLQQPTKTQNELGEEIDGWADVFGRWAKVLPKRGKETVEAAQQHATASHTIEIRHCRQIKPNMRVLWTDEQQEQHIFNILSVAHVGERRIKTIISCTEVIAYG